MRNVHPVSLLTVRLTNAELRCLCARALLGTVFRLLCAKVQQLVSKHVQAQVQKDTTESDVYNRGDFDKLIIILLYLLTYSLVYLLTYLLVYLLT